MRTNRGRWCVEKGKEFQTDVCIILIRLQVGLCMAQQTQNNRPAGMRLSC